jgi:thioredoxin-like negative regulator of GroEL
MTGEELRDKVDQSQGIVLYFKNDRCAPCLAIRTKVEDLVTTKFPKMDFIIVDTVTDPMLSNEFKVFANPTILTFFEGKEYSRKSKYISIEGLREETERLYNMVF